MHAFQVYPVWSHSKMNSALSVIYISEQAQLQCFAHAGQGSRGGSFRITLVSAASWLRGRNAELRMWHLTLINLA